ncbi:MAG: sulfotransferase [Solirubrobacterales bacterium]
MWPNLFLVGAAKAGTTSVYDELARHPAIYMSPMKEPHYFSRIRPSHERAAFFPHITDEDEYKALFDGVTEERLVGEASTSYLWDANAAERIQGVAPDASILIMLRNPVERAYSQYWNDVREGIEARSFTDALAEERRSGPGVWGVTSLYLDCGRYANQVPRYLERFGERVLVSFFEDFVADQAGTVTEIHAFLEVDPAGGAAGTSRMNPTALPRNLLSGRMLGSGRLRTLARATVPRALRARARGALLKEVSPPPMDPEARAMLVEVFRPEVDRVAELLGRQTPWELG